MAVLDVLDRATSLPFPEFRQLPPNRLRIRVGVGNRILFNQSAFLEYGAGTFLGALKAGTLTFDSHIVDIGCGCGRFPHALWRFGFSGRYDGIDVDREMISWCESFFDQEIYRFHFANVYSNVYNPEGERESYRLPVDDGAADLVIGQSLLTHLLEDDLRNYVFESARALAAGGHMDMGVFCLEDMRDLDLLGGRWRFPHSVGSARVQSTEYPEAAVAYEKAFLTDLCHEAGFESVSIIRSSPQSRLFCRR
jgi:SAM-dependent methyltransferase